MSEEEKKEEELCKTRFPFQKLFDYQNKYIEHRDPSIYQVSGVIEATGDIFRSMCNTMLVDKMYLNGKIKILQDLVDRWVLEDEREKCRSATKEKMEAMDEYMEKVKAFEDVVKEFPTCNMENRRIIQEKSIQLIKDFANWGMDKLPTEIIRQLVGNYINEVKSLVDELEIHWNYSTDGNVITIKKEVTSKTGENITLTTELTDKEFECVVNELADEMKKSRPFISNAIISGEIDFDKLRETQKKCEMKKASIFERFKKPKSKK